jgi:uncharacterized protein YdeI (YjbR/CyaY-like superfamily)
MATAPAKEAAPTRKAAAPAAKKGAPEKKPTPADPTYFAKPEAFRRWLAKHHETAPELLVGFHKVGSGQASMSWPESVDEALCAGWIDGVRRRVDDDRYTIRFTPRRASSIWSAINIKRVEVLQAEGRMLPAGLKAFAARKENKSGIYAYEQRPEALPPEYEKLFKKHKAAWAFYQTMPHWYRKTTCWLIISAKTEATRLKRLNQLIDDCANGRTVAQLRWKGTGNKP